MSWARGIERTFGAWPLQCPVDGTWLKTGTVECPDCGLSTTPLQALAAVAFEQLSQAREEGPVAAERLVANAVALVPPSEAFLLDCADTLMSAGAATAAVPFLKKASALAPARRDIKAMLTAIEPVPPRTIADEVSPGATARAALVAEHAAARSVRDAAELGSAEYIAACEQIAQIEVAMARLLT
jgi:hypothetical protein